MLNTLEATTPPARTRWKFRVGDRVDHRSGGMASVVIWRGSTTKGLHLYGLAAGADNTMRIFRGDFLVRAQA